LIFRRANDNAEFMRPVIVNGFPSPDLVEETYHVNAFFRKGPRVTHVDFPGYLMLAGS